MSLPNKVIADFCEVVVTEDAKPAGSTSYGYVKVVDNATYVQLDGSEQLTPVNTSVGIKDGDRVIVSIKNHEAVVTGNVTDISTSTSTVTTVAGRVADIEYNYVKTDTLEANYISAKQIAATYATIDTLNASEVNAGKLYATQATVETLTSDVGTFKDLTTKNFEATNASISKLETEKVSADTLEANYAKISQLEVVTESVGKLEANKANVTDLNATNASIEALDAKKADISTLESDYIKTETVEANYAKIDFANIGEAAIEKLFSDSGMIKDLVLQDGQVTGVLQGVTILGDSIEAGTLKADRLIIKDSTDGLYYQLNVNGSNGVTAEQTDLNSLNGTYIQAKSIAADKIAVTDLSAFNATIGGFTIDSDAIRTNGLSSATALGQGIFLGDDGQFYVGSGSDAYLRLYLEDDTWKFELVVGGVSFSALDDRIEKTEASISSTIDSVHDLSETTSESFANVNDQIAANKSAQEATNAELSAAVDSKVSVSAFDDRIENLFSVDGTVVTKVTNDSGGVTYDFNQDAIALELDDRYGLTQLSGLNGYIHLGKESADSAKVLLYLAEGGNVTKNDDGTLSIDSGFAVQLDPEGGLGFYNGPTKVSWFDQLTEYITSAYILNDLIVGYDPTTTTTTDFEGFAFSMRDVSGTKHLGLRVK